MGLAQPLDAGEEPRAAGGQAEPLEAGGHRVGVGGDDRTYQQLVAREQHNLWLGACGTGGGVLVGIGEQSPGRGMLLDQEGEKVHQDPSLQRCVRFYARRGSCGIPSTWRSPTVRHPRGSLPVLPGAVPTEDEGPCSGRGPTTDGPVEEHPARF